MKDCMVIRTYSTGSFGTNSLEEYLNKGYSIVTVNSFGAGLEYVLEKKVDTATQTVSLESNYFKLVERYLKDTKDCDETLFCGCRKEDCSYYMFLPECHKCLEKHLREEF